MFGLLFSSVKPHLTNLIQPSNTNPYLNLKTRFTFFNSCSQTLDSSSPSRQLCIHLNRFSFVIHLNQFLHSRCLYLIFLYQK
ncbi:hypothetical protein HanRHA438_Chr10g0443401 [Helianthus annuus]|nr:hypothetical protein HanRHA438_Chr10g0443401 [Helianthus annuus]